MNRTPEERRWASAIDRARFGVWDLDPRRELVHYPPQWKARFGFPRIHAPDSSTFWRCRVHPDDFAPMVRSLRAHLDGSSVTYEACFRLRSNGAGYRTVRSRGRVVARDAEGRATRMVGTMVDVHPLASTGRKSGLASDGPEPSPRWSGPPFHAVFTVEERTVAGAVEERRRLVDRVGDLLDVALRESGAAG